VVVLEFSIAKNLGFGGSIAVIIGILISFIPALSSLGSILMLLGIILVLVALRGLSEVYGDESIFWNALGATIAIILAWILFFVFLATTVLSPLGVMASAIALILVVAAVATSALLWYRALGALSSRSGVRMFRWAAISYAISSVIFVFGLLLTIVLIGIFILLIAGVVDLLSFILLALGFLSLKTPVTPALQGMKLKPVELP
jgi:uncharacterized membrane protein